MEIRDCEPFRTQEDRCVGGEGVAGMGLYLPPAFRQFFFQFPSRPVVQCHILMLHHFEDVTLSDFFLSNKKIPHSSIYHVEFSEHVNARKLANFDK